MDKHLKIKQIEASINCLRKQLALLTEVASVSIILETVSMLENELQELKQLL